MGSHPRIFFMAGQWSQPSGKGTEEGMAASLPRALPHYDLPAIFFSSTCPAITNSISCCLKSSAFCLLSVYLPTTFLPVPKFKLPIDSDKLMRDPPECSAPLGRILIPGYLSVTGQLIHNCPNIRCPSLVQSPVAEVTETQGTKDGEGTLCLAGTLKNPSRGQHTWEAQNKTYP